ncbi:MAG: AAA family ATPase [Polaribacter sp.]
MKLQQARRNAVKLRIGLSAPSGFGKSYSALLLAYGITKDYNKIAVIDTENGSASLYSDLGNYQVLDLQPPFSPERYMKAISICENSGVELIILDSISHEWNGKGGCLDMHNKLGGRFQDWAIITPRHQAFIDKILQSNCHVITTVRRKTDYSMEKDQSGKTKVVKHGLKEVTREGFEYELSVNFEIINDNHLVKASKDRTGLFDVPEFVITPETGEKLIEWCSSTINMEEMKLLITSSENMVDLKSLYNEYPQYQEKLHDEFLHKRENLEANFQGMKLNNKVAINEPTKFSQNGTTEH